MARTIYDIYLLSQYIARKERGVFQTVPEFNQNIDAGLLDFTNEYFQFYGKTQQIHDAIKKFRAYQPFTSDSAGFVTFQTNYLHLIGTPFTVFGSSVSNPRFVNEDDFPDALTSQLRPCDNDNPVLVDSANGFSIYPQTTQTGAYFYLRRPTSPLLVVTQVGRAITYDPINSVQIEASEIYWNNILGRALKYLGINLDDKGISDFSNQLNAETK